MKKLEDIPGIESALRDYFDLLNRAYPEKRTRLLVADRYRLDRSMRTLLFRGVFPDRVNLYRSSRRKKPPFPASTLLSVDFLNVVLVLMNYLYGRGVFISSDGFVRDEGENFKRFDSSDILFRSLHLLRDVLPRLGIGGCRFFVDRNPALIIPPELRDRDFLKASLGVPGMETTVTLSDHVDRELIALGEGLIASSDSRILDRTPLPTMDLAGFILREAFETGLPNILSILYPDVLRNGNK